MILQENTQSQVQVPNSGTQQKETVVGDMKGIGWDFFWEDQLSDLTLPVKY